MDTYLLDKMEKGKRFTNVGGRFFYKPTRFSLSGASGPRGENVALPVAGTQDFDDIQIPVRFHYGVIEVTGPVMALSRGQRNAFAEALQLTMDGMYDEFRFVAGIMVHGPGTGVLGVVESVSSNVLTLRDTNLPINWFYENLRIDAYQSDESTLRQAGMKVTDVDIDARKITVDSAGSTAANDRLYLASGKDVAFHGLLAGVDDGTYVGTYLAIDRTAAGRKKWKSYVNAGPDGVRKYQLTASNTPTQKRSITPSLIQKMLDQQRVRAGASRAIDLFYCSLGVRRAIWESLSPDRRFNSSIYDGGWEQLKYSQGDRAIPVQGDELCPKYTLFGLHTGTRPAPQTSKRPSKIEDEEQFAIYEAQEAEWDEATGSQLKQVYSAVGANATSFIDAVGAFLKWYANIATCRPNTHARLDDIAES